MLPSQSANGHEVCFRIDGEDWFGKDDLGKGSNPARVTGANVTFEPGSQTA